MNIDKDNVFEIDNDGSTYECDIFRAEGISDKDAATLYNLTPRRTLGEMWSDKCGVSHTAEDDNDENLFTIKALAFFPSKPMLNLRRYLVQDGAMPFIRAEILGDFEVGCLVKVLAQTPIRHKMASDRELAIRELRVPEATWIEIQHALIASGATKCIFISTVDGTQVTEVLVKQDNVFRSNHVAQCITFWDYVRRSVLPPGAVMPVEPTLDDKKDEAQLQIDLDNSKGSSV